MTEDTNGRGKTNKSDTSVRLLSLRGKQWSRSKQAVCVGFDIARWGEVLRNSRTRIRLHFLGTALHNITLFRQTLSWSSSNTVLNILTAANYLTTPPPLRLLRNRMLVTAFTRTCQSVFSAVTWICSIQQHNDSLTRYQKLQVMLSLYFIVDKAMTSWVRRRRVVPRMISHGARRRWVARFTVPPLCTWMHIHWYQFGKRVCHKRGEKLIIKRGTQKSFYSICYTVIWKFQKAEWFKKLIKLFNWK